MKIMKGRALRATATAAMLAVFGAPVMAEELFYVSGAVGKAVENFNALVQPWEDATGHTVTLVPMPASTTDQFGQYRLWLTRPT
jgi:trehalose/maltose transport system substrate-binding protein